MKQDGGLRVQSETVKEYRKKVAEDMNVADDKKLADDKERPWNAVGHPWDFDFDDDDDDDDSQDGPSK